MAEDRNKHPLEGAQELDVSGPGTLRRVVAWGLALAGMFFLALSITADQGIAGTQGAAIATAFFVLALFVRG